ncbi:MAG: hypothetical protein J6S91_02270, partial [Treponema sp.]|nr:hypothetical protein [Treponema sp.]
MKRAGMIGRVFVAFVLVLFGLTSCQVGLGAAVDTSDPRAGVLVPSAASPYVGGPTIHIAGTCEDDTGIAEVRIVTLRNDDSGREYNDLGNATLSEDGRSWSFDLIQTGSSKSTYTYAGRDLTLTDGRYTLTILPVDLGGRSPRYGVERQFEIDNTPPIFLISSPNSVDIGDPTPYGQTVKIKGDIIDAHGLRELNVSVHDTAGTEVALGNTRDMAGIQGKDMIGFELTLAKKQYKDGETSDSVALDNFSSLYPDGSSGEKYYYMDIELEDSVNLGTELPGNRARCVYFRGPLYEVIREATGVGNFDYQELRKAYNGTSEFFTAQQCDTIRQILDLTYDTSDGPVYYAKAGGSGNRLAFSVNPNNNPKYSFGGMSFTDPNHPAGWSGRGAAGGSVTLMVSASSDEEEALILPSTIKVKLIPVESDGTRLVGQAVTSDEPDGPRLELGSTPVESAVYTVTLPSEDKLTHTWYELVALGEDASGYTLEPNNGNGFGFMLYSSRIPVTITPDEDSAFKSKTDGNRYEFGITVNDPNQNVTINTTNGSIKYQVKKEEVYRTKQYFSSISWDEPVQTVAGTNLHDEGAGNFSLSTPIEIPFTVSDGNVGTVAIRMWGDN